MQIMSLPRRHPQALGFVKRLRSLPATATTIATLSDYFARGIVVQEDSEEASKLLAEVNEEELRQKAEQGNPNSQYQVGRLLILRKNDWSEATPWYLKAAKQGPCDSERRSPFGPNRLPFSFTLEIASVEFLALTRSCWCSVRLGMVLPHWSWC